MNGPYGNPNYQSPPYPMAPMFPQCRVCGHSGPAWIKSQITTGAWVLSIFLFFTVCGTLFFWIPLVTMTDKHSMCSGCKVRL
jgi:hypothetical protein